MTVSLCIRQDQREMMTHSVWKNLTGLQKAWKNAISMLVFIPKHLFMALSCKVSPCHNLSSLYKLTQQHPSLQAVSASRIDRAVNTAPTAEKIKNRHLSGWRTEVGIMDNVWGVKHSQRDQIVWVCFHGMYNIYNHLCVVSKCVWENAHFFSLLNCRELFWLTDKEFLTLIY